MKKIILFLFALTCMCACDRNVPDDIYAPITANEQQQLEKRIADNYNCLVVTLSKRTNPNDTLYLRKFESVQQMELGSLDELLRPLFGSLYINYMQDTVIDGKYITRSTLNARMFKVTYIGSWTREKVSEKEWNDLWELGGGGNLYFDSQFNLINTINCDCWE